MPASTVGCGVYARCCHSIPRSLLSPPPLAYFVPPHAPLGCRLPSLEVFKTPAAYESYIRLEEVPTRKEVRESGML